MLFYVVKNMCEEKIIEQNNEKLCCSQTLGGEDVSVMKNISFYSVRLGTLTEELKQITVTTKQRQERI